MEYSIGAAQRRSGGIPVGIIIAAIVAAAGIAVGWLLLRGGPPQRPAPVLTPEARTYIHDDKLKLADVNMSAKENFAQQTLVEITGKITNAGERPVKTVDLYCVFKDPYGRPVLRELVPIVSTRMGGLLPGQTKDFRLPFDTIPGGWNQALPDLVIAEIDFGQP